jgi:GxxExxY protein
VKHQGHEERQEHQEPDRRLDELAKIVVDAGLKVHKTLGPGLLESVYEHCLAQELQARGVAFQRQPAAAAGPDHGYGCRLDLVVAEAIVVEIGAVDAPARLHDPEVLARLRQSGRRLGLRLDFDAQPFSAGVQRFVI